MKETINVRYPDMYAKKKFAFGTICVAYFEGTDECIMVSYWGKDNVFERILEQGNSLLESVVGTYNDKGVEILEVSQSIPRNLALRRKEVSEAVSSLLLNIPSSSEYDEIGREVSGRISKKQ